MTAGSPTDGITNTQIAKETTEKAVFYLSSDLKSSHTPKKKNKKIKNTLHLIFRRLGLLSKLQHLNVQLTSHWVLNTVPNQHCFKKELNKYLISDFSQPPVFVQHSHFKNFSLLTVFLNLHILVHPTNNLFQQTWIITFISLCNVQPL